MYFHFENQTLFLSTAYLAKLGVNRNSIKKWRQRNIGQWLKMDEALLINYKTIPLATKKKLPTEQTLRSFFKETERSKTLESIYKALEHAYYLDHSKYKSIYETDSDLASEKVTKFARLHSVFQSIIELKQNERFRDLAILYEAFNKLLPGKYSCKHALSNAIRKAINEGIMNVALDKRAFGNNNEETNTKVSPLQKFWLANITGHPAKFSCSEIHEYICKACDETKQNKPSLSWVKKWRKKLLQNPVLYNERYGKQEANKVLPFASLNYAVKSNDRWELDAKKIPLYGDKFQDYYLEIVQDNCSKKIIGYAIGKTENSVLIMDALRDAVTKTGVLPFELVTDKHSFTQTKEAENLKALLNKKGSQWKVTMNPREKVVVERYNQYLDAIWKKEYGYYGKGVKSKSKEALVKPEQMDKYIKNFLSEDLIKAHAIKAVEIYNNTIQKKTGKTPNEMYEENLNPHPITVSQGDKAELFINVTDKKVIAGQITFLRSNIKHEFQLPAHLYQDYNGTTVKVRYDDLRDGIYLFESRTNEFIIFIEPKEKINTAIVNQTDEDKQKLFRHKGRIKGIIRKAEKQLEDIAEKAFMVDPEAHERINVITTPKHILQAARQDSNIRVALADHGVNLNNISEESKPIADKIPSLQPKQKVTDKALTVKNNTIEIVNTNEDFYNDAIDL